LPSTVFLFGIQMLIYSLMFEQVPSDYSFLQMFVHPPTGGDTLWASGTEIYNRLSTKMQKYLQSLTMTSDQQENLVGSAKKGGFQIWQEPRGHPLNSGENFRPVHPMIRTNPVTGLNSVYGIGLHCNHINDVTKAESDYLKKMLLDMLTSNHDLQCRFRWLPKSCAIWDNRSYFHSIPCAAG
jgi:alpha-ketoglutarate-dependent taurine dioxygenase